MNWRKLAEDDYFLFARSYRMAARKLADGLDHEPGPIPEFDLSPVLSAYRLALELHLKVIVLGEGGAFLSVRPDVLSIQKTRSLPLLAQFVCQIVKTLRWEAVFCCDGVRNLAEFRAAIDEAHEIDPEYGAFQCAAGSAGLGGQERVSVLEFVRRLEGLLQLLEGIADAMAAEWDLRCWAGGDEGGPVGEIPVQCGGGGWMEGRWPARLPARKPGGSPHGRGLTHGGGGWRVGAGCG
ncbi:hypothetical protein [Paludibaculum fermentans]|uniref:hypothetical protein n=1 Tax=Paludibaculum fermentans TaxID=1473598 RepID=UPI003EBC01A0